jgi:sugar O-acyltransferase (sialic acid O-acetyltransferase NeuD family)
VHAVNAVAPRWNLLGFLDDGLPGGAEVMGLPVLGGVDALDDLPDTRVTLCTARPGRYWSRRELETRLALPTERFATVVHPSASLPRSISIGHGTVLLGGVVATASVTIGSHVVVMPATVLTHDDVIGDHATFGAGVRLGGGVDVGVGAYVGSGAMVREGLRIGAWSLVGMGSAVLTEVPAGEIWAGVPARHLRDADVPGEIMGGRHGRT